VTLSPEDVAEAFVAACLAELDAPKPGNVHHFAPGHRMSPEDFVRSARISAGPLTEAGARVGARVRNAVTETLAAVGQNTNLGILLLCGPLARAAERQEGDLRGALAATLNDLDRDDAAAVFAAIVAANPGGLGESGKHDVRAPADVTLKQAMEKAAGRDRIARQFSSAYGDVFTIGLPALAEARARMHAPRWATLAVYLAFLATAPDTHVARKFGIEMAETVKGEATPWRRKLTKANNPDALLRDLLAWDASLKARGLNPGASADLTVATLFADSLMRLKPGN
jgi:triphosphoribosyl-dephospho-CoA synthase